jgi:Bacterial regulatory proteins, lacI family/Periplasmic binding proteins and sugar binding domain of LacI family
MARSATLSDVAKAAKLSPTTVSRHLNGSINLPEDTVRRIDAAIAALRYRPNPHARSLGRGRSDTIGLVIPDIANPFFAKLAAAVEIAADTSGLGVMLCSTFNRQARELDYIDRLRKNFVDGLLFATNHVDDGALAASVNASSGVVLVDEDIPGSRGPKVFCGQRTGWSSCRRVPAGRRSSQPRLYRRPARIDERARARSRFSHGRSRESGWQYRRVRSVRRIHGSSWPCRHEGDPRRAPRGDGRVRRKRRNPDWHARNAARPEPKGWRRHFGGNLRRCGAARSA